MFLRTVTTLLITLARIKARINQKIPAETAVKIPAKTPVRIPAEIKLAICRQHLEEKAGSAKVWNWFFLCGTFLLPAEYTVIYGKDKEWENGNWYDFSMGFGIQAG